MKMISFGVAVVLVLGSGFSPARAQCASKPTAKPAIEGAYMDNFGGIQIISDSFWVSGSFVFEICSVDNTKKELVAFNSQRNSFNPGKFSRFNWQSDKNRLWYCP